jgi:hypothetical protein
MSTKYEARFYCHDNNNIIYYVGMVGGETKTDPKDLSDDDHLIDNLFDQAIECVSFNPVIKFEKSPTSHFEVFKTRSKEGRHLLLLWLGSREPESKVISSKRVLPVSPSERSERRVTLPIPSIRYDLNLDSLMALSSRLLFLTLLNAHIKTINDVEHAELLTEDKYLRFLFFQDSEFLPPYAYAYLRKIGEAMPEHQKLLKKCPPDYLSCEITEFYQGFFVFIKKEAWLERKEVKLEDTLLGD